MHSLILQNNIATVCKLYYELIMFDGAVYKEMPWHLKEQMAEAMAHVKAHPEACPSDVPVQ